MVKNEVMEKFRTLYLPDCPTQQQVFVSEKSAFLPQDTLTVRCRIWKSGGNLSETISARSRIEVVEDCFLWNVERFSQLELDQKVTTPVYLRFIQGLNIFHLSFSLAGEALRASEARLEVTAEQVMEAMSMKVKVSVCDLNAVVKSVEHRYFHNKSTSMETCDAVPIASREAILEETSDCIHDDVLSLFCEVTAVLRGISEYVDRKFHGPTNLLKNCAGFDIESSETISLQKDDDAAAKRSVEVLQDDFMSLYREKSLSDFELRSGEVSFPVHRVVLSARSPAFSAESGCDLL